MVPGLRFLTAGSLILCTLAILAGCITYTIGETTYSGGNITIHLANAGDPSEDYIQVTVYEIRNLRQEEFTVLNRTVLLQKGENEVIVPANLPPGSYKLYIYLIRNYDRQSAGIRDIVVD